MKGERYQEVLMGLFPKSHVCPLAVKRNESRCIDPAGKPDAVCDACRNELASGLGKAMLDGDVSFFEMLFAGHTLEKEGFVGVRDEDGGIQLERTQSKLKEQPGDCAIGAVPSKLGGGYRLFIVIDDDHEISEVYDSLEGALRSYFGHKDVIEELTQNAPADG